MEGKGVLVDEWRVAEHRLSVPIKPEFGGVGARVEGQTWFLLGAAGHAADAVVVDQQQQIAHSVDQETVAGGSRCDGGCFVA